MAKTHRSIEDLVNLFSRVIQEEGLINIVDRLKTQGGVIRMFRDISNEDFIEAYGSVVLKSSNSSNREHILHFQVEKNEYPAIVWALTPNSFDEYEPQDLEWGHEFIDPNVEEDFPMPIEDYTPLEIWEYVKERVVSKDLSRKDELLLVSTHHT